MSRIPMQTRIRYIVGFRFRFAVLHMYEQSAGFIRVARSTQVASPLSSRRHLLVIRKYFSTRTRPPILHGVN